jgi:MtrB/PioB family decaheme-associated outer membrane protein
LRSFKTALLGGTLLIVPAAQALAQDANAVVAGWYSYGNLTAGSNIFVEKPPSGFGKTDTPPFWITPSTGDSRAKMDEYGKIPRSVFLKELWISGGRTDGRFDADIWADWVGTDFQRYQLRFYEAGQHYFSLGWDQTPHLLSTSAKSIFGGVGSTRLTVDPASRTFLQSQMANSQTQAQRDNIDDFINGRNLFGGAGFPAPIGNIELKTLREKFTAGYRNTMLSDWEFNFDYSNEHRTGTRPLDIGYGFSTTTANPRPSAGAVEVPAPVNDRTQNADASAEYLGSTPWGRFNSSVKYSGSFYDNKNKFFDTDNPFCITCSATAAPFGPSLFRYALDPSNNVNGITWNSMIDLPMQTRYTGTVQYMMFRQNDPFIDTATNGLTFGTGPGQLNPYPAASLNGEVNAFLTNNVFYTRITPEFTNTLRVRYYDRDDQTPQLTFTNYALADGGISTTQPLTRLSTSYTRFNVSDDLKWQPNRVWTFGAGYFFERFTRAHGEVDATNESGGRAFFTYQPYTWFTTRSSLQYSQRRYENFVVSPTADPAVAAMRPFYVMNRNQTKADGSIDIQLTKNLTLIPNGGIRWIDYPTDTLLNEVNLATNSLGVQRDHQWFVGTDLALRITPELRTTFGYNFEEHRLYLENCCGSGSTPFADQNKWSSQITQRYHVFMTSALWNAIPGKLDIRADYIAALTNEANDTIGCAANLTGCTGKNATTDPPVVWPDERNIFQRVNVMAFYYVDPSVVKQMGWVGNVTLKARYTWERNDNSNWATDNFTPYSPSPADAGGIDITNGGKSLFLAYNNPNYTAQIVTLAASVAW